MKKENVKSADRKPEVYTDDKGRRRVRMVSVDRKIVKIDEKSVSKAQQKFFGIVRGLQKGEIDNASPEAKKAAASMSKKDVKDFAATKHKGLPAQKEGYIGAKGEKGRDYRNAGTFDKDTAYSHAKTHNGVVHKDPSGKYLVKHGRGKNVSEGWRSGGGGHRSPFKAYSTGGSAQSTPSRRDAKYKELSHEYETDKKLARLKQLQRQKAKQQPVKKEESSKEYGKSLDRIRDKEKKAKIKPSELDKLARLRNMMKNANEESVNLKTFTTFISELTDKQRAEIAKRKAANQAKRGARRGPAKGTKSSEGDWTADQQKSAKPLSFEINKNDKHDDVHKTLAKAADASHPSLGGRKVKVKINGKSKEMAHKDLQHAVDLHKRLPLDKKKAVMDLIRDKGHEGVTAAANHFRKTYK